METLEGRCVTDVTGGCSSALTALRFVESEPMKGGVDFLITGLAILHGSALREMADVTLAVEAMEVLVFFHEH